MTILVEHNSEMDSPEYWAKRPYVPDDLRERILKADILIVPRENFRGIEDPLFPTGTEETYAFLKARLPMGVSVELPIADEAYEELALHSALIILGIFIATQIATPVLVSLLSEAIKHRFPHYFNGKNSPEAKLEIAVTRPDGSSVRVTYTGPADRLESEVLNALAGRAIGDAEAEEKVTPARLHHE